MKALIAAFDQSLYARTSNTSCCMWVYPINKNTSQHSCHKTHYDDSALVFDPIISDVSRGRANNCRSVIPSNGISSSSRDRVRLLKIYKLHLSPASF